MGEILESEIFSKFDYFRVDDEFKGGKCGINFRVSDVILSVIKYSFNNIDDVSYCFENKYHKNF